MVVSEAPQLVVCPNFCAVLSFLKLMMYMKQWRIFLIIRSVHGGHDGENHFWESKRYAFSSKEEQMSI